MNRIFLLFSFITSIILFHWYNNNNRWQETNIEKKIINWHGANTIALINNNKGYDIKILDIINKNIVQLDYWNIEVIDLDKNFSQLKKLSTNNSVIYVICTKIPINNLYSYLINSSLVIKNPFIIINIHDISLIIHNFFFNKSIKDNDYIKLPFINLNLMDGISVRQFIESHYGDLEYYVLYGNDEYNINEIIQQHFKDIGHDN